MLGLKTQESEKFEKFFNIVQNSAKKQNCVFFLYAGDGNEFETEKLEGEDLMGWLIPKDKSSEFENEWKNNTVSDDWTDFFVWALWNDAENPHILFK